jgi:uncharacterized membrane protein YfhO
MLLPAYYGLQLTNSANNSFPSEMSFYESWVDIFANTLSYTAPATKEGLPNFACGMLAIVLFGVFLFAAGIKIREKISALLMLAIIAVSCNMNILNYIWHGFHFTNMIPYRFAFIFSFVLIGAAYRAYDILLKNGIKVYQLIAMCAFPWLVFYLNYMASADSEDGFSFKTENIRSSLVITCALILVFIAVKVFPFTRPRVRNTIMSLCIGAAVITECYSNAVLGVQTVGHSDYNSYLTADADIQVLLDKADELDDSLFYRTETTKTWTLNDSSLYGYYGISQFSSAANVSVTRFIKKLGLYGSDAGNRYYYRISTPIVNSMLGLHYILSKDGIYNSEEMALRDVGVSGNVHLYQNNYPLSLGYMVDSSILDLENKSYSNPFEYQNELMRYFTGLDEDCFTPQVVALAEYGGVTVNKNGYGNYTFTKDTADETGCFVVYTFDGVEDSYLYGYATNGGCSTISVSSEGATVDSGISVEDYPIVFPMGNAQEGSQTSVTLKIKDDSNSGSYNLMVYALSQSVFEDVYNKLADEQLDITEFSDTEINGKITALEDGVMFLSIPYEKGWSVYVDGVKTDTVKLMDSMLGVELAAGEHDISIKYVPEGFVPGVATSTASAVICAGIAFIDTKKRKKKQSVEPIGYDDAPEENAEEPVADTDAAPSEETENPLPPEFTPEADESSGENEES